MTLLTRESVEEVSYKEMDPIVRSRVALKSVPEFNDIHVHTELVRPIDSGVGEVLETKPCIRMSHGAERDPSGRDDLDRPAKILSAKFVYGKKSRPDSDVERH